MPDELTDAGKLRQKLKTLYERKEALRLEHNAEGKRYRDGEITFGEFGQYKKGWFREHIRTCEDIGAVKIALLKIVEWPIQEIKYDELGFQEKVKYPLAATKSIEKIHYLLILIDEFRKAEFDELEDAIDKMDPRYPTLKLYGEVYEEFRKLREEISSGPS